MPYPVNTDSPHHPSIDRIRYDTPTGKHECASDEYVIGYVFGGTYRLYDRSAKRCTEIKPDHIYILPVGDYVYEAFPGENGDFEQVVIRFTDDDLRNVVTGLSIIGEENVLTDRMASPAGCPCAIIRADESTRLLFRSLSAPDDRRRDRSDSYIRFSLAVYFVTHSGLPLRHGFGGEGPGCDNSKFAREIYANIYSNLSLEEISSKCCLSISSFKRKFRRYFNTSPHKWFLGKRICRARRMIVDTDMSMSEIGVACGFNNQSHFIKLFKRYYGMTPMICRRMYSSPLPVEKPAADTCEDAAGR